MPSLNLGLAVSDVVSVNVSLAPTAAPLRNFGVALIMGDSDVIDLNSRFRNYTSSTAVAVDFGATAPEALAAAIYFGQNPTPSNLLVGAWARGPVAGRLVGGVLSAAQQLVTNFSTIASGGMNITIDGGLHTLAGVSFIGATNLNAVAATVTAALAGSGTVIWDNVNYQFTVRSATTGATSTVSLATPPATGIDISGILGLSAGNAVTGSAGETPAAAVTAALAMSNNWYGLMFASSVATSSADKLAIAGLIQGSSVSRIYAINTSDPAALDPTQSTDIGSLLAAGGFSRTYVQYSTTPHGVAASLGDAFTVNFAGINTALTLKFQQQKSIVGEVLSETQAQALKTKNINAYVLYNNGVSILQEGVMSNGTFFDIIQGTDWLQNAVQTAIFNALYQAKTKIPQTDAGVNVLLTQIANQCDQGVQNGLIGPGQWNGPPIGVLLTGQTLVRGYYIYAPPIATQSAAARGARQSPVMTACIKLAGAIHSAAVIINVNS